MGKVEPEPKIDNFGSATLLNKNIKMTTAGTRYGTGTKCLSLSGRLSKNILSKIVSTDLYGHQHWGRQSPWPSRHPSSYRIQTHCSQVKKELKESNRSALGPVQSSGGEELCKTMSSTRGHEVHSTIF